MKKFILGLLLAFSLNSVAHAEAARKINPADCLPSVSANDLNYGKQCANDEDFKKAKPAVGKYEKGKGVPVTKIGGGYSSLIHSLPTVGKIALRLAKGYNNIALGLAIVEMLGKQVDWILNPENNSVTVGEPFTKCKSSNDLNGYKAGTQVTPEQACSLIGSGKFKSISSEFYTNYRDSKYSGYPIACESSGGYTTYFVCASPKTEIPLDEIAEELQRMAEAGEVEAQKAIEDTVEDMAKEGELDAELERAKKLIDETKKVDSTADTNNTTGAKENVNAKEETNTKKEKNDKEKEEQKPFELPKFCEWAKPVCDFVEWVKKEPEQPNNKPIDIDKVEMPKESVKIDFSATCPPDRGFTFSFVGRQMVFNFSYSNLCKIAISLGSVVKVISTILATYILLGIRS